MPLRIDTTKCKDYESFTEDQNYNVATTLYAVGIGQITPDNYDKVMLRVIMLNLAARRETPAGSFDIIRQYIGCHTNVSDESDFKFNKKIIGSITDSATYLLSVNRHEANNA